MVEQEVVTEIALAHLDKQAKALPKYARALNEACAASPPPFGQAWYGDRFREHAVNPDWMANSLVQNAQKEADGARQLWRLAGRTPDPDIAEAVRVHAIDEARHARYYIAMLELAFPGAAETATREAFLSKLPKFSGSDQPERTPAASHEAVFDELIQMNIGEIRTLIHQLLMRPVLTLHCPEDNLSQLAALLESIADDEVTHIAYTANLIEARCEDDEPGVLSVFKKRVSDFNALTLEEVGMDSFH